MHMMN